MLKKLISCSCFAIFLLGNAHAETPAKKGPTYSIVTTDTSGDKIDSLGKPSDIADPKDAFKGLFVTATSPDGVTMEELNPMAVSFVEDYMEKFGKKMEDIKENGKVYFGVMDAVLVQHGLPKELKYIAVIESNLKSNARSGAGAVGPWQFMPTTARNMGLKVGYNVDERRDLYKSTHAASRYLTSLFAMYGDWLLVIAAYNGGPGNVDAAIRKSGSRDFWKLQQFLPLESRNHVKKFIATHYMMEGVGGITTLTKGEVATRLLADTSRIVADNINTKLQSITGRYNSLILAKHIEIDIAEFNKYNPGFDKVVASNGKYELLLPANKMDIFLVRKFDILNESLQLLLDPDAVSKSKMVVGNE
jgi:membrane-bound lytic murein transglycosylase D